MKRKIIAVLLTAVLTVTMAALTGCGSGSQETEKTAEAPVTNESTQESSQESSADGKYNFDPVHVGTEENSDSDSSKSDSENTGGSGYNFGSVSTSAKAPDLQSASDKKYSFDTVKTKINAPDLKSAKEYDLSLNPVSTKFSIDLKERVKIAIPDAVGVNFDLDLGEVNLVADTLFEYDKSELTDQGKSSIDKFFAPYISEILAEDSMDALSYIDFGGHCDSDGDFEYNLKLSTARAQTVYDYVKENCLSGLSDKQIAKFGQVAHVNGYSYSDPVLDANGNENKAASRRVTIRYYFNAQQLSQ